MRRTLLILGTFLFLGALFALYSFTQTPTINEIPSGGKIVARAPQSGNGDGTMGPLGPGQGVWVSQYDGARLSNRFRAGEFNPKPDGTVEAIDFEAQVMLSNGGTIRLEATSGLIYVRSGPSSGKSPLGKTTPQGASRGKLQDVTIHVTDATGTPLVAMKVNNVAFDLDTFRIYTEAYTDPTGATVAADRVKVEVRGEDVDFDGYGLTLRWDDRSGIIQSLEIAHGEKIVIKKSPQGLAMGSMPSQQLDRNSVRMLNDQPAFAFPWHGPPARGATILRRVGPYPVRTNERKRFSLFDDASGVRDGLAGPTASSDGVPSDVPEYRHHGQDAHVTVRIPSRPLMFEFDGDVRPIELAATEGVALPATTIVSPKKLVLYRVRLLEGVRIVQGDQILGTGDTLTIDFLTESGSGGKSKTQKAVTAATLPAPVAPTTVAAPTVIAAPTTATTTAPPAEPITVFWTGPLLMVPLGDGEAPLGELTAGNAIAELSGQTVTLQQAGATVRAGSALYRTTDGGAALRPAAGQDVVTITDADGRTLTTAAIDFDGVAKVATLAGIGKLNVPATPETDGKPVTAQWSKGATIYLSGDDRAQSLDRIDCAGDVVVVHPQLNLTAQAMGIHFAPGADPKKPTLKQVTARDRVKVVTHDVKEGNRTIETDALVLDMKLDAKGNPSPERFTATGRVHAYDEGGQHLHSNSLVATLGAGKKSDEIALEKMVAEGNVTVRGKEAGTAASAERMIVTMDGDQAQVEMTGPNGATVTSEDGTLRGRSIKISPDDSTAHIVGAGSLDAVVRGENGKGKRPVRITWTDGATFMAKKNLVEVTGDVHVEMKSADGLQVDASRSKRVRITLADKVAAVGDQNPKQDDKSKSPLGGGGDSFGNKEPVAVTLLDDVEVSTVEALDNALARQFVMQTQEVRYDLKSQTLRVPGAGRALYKDVRPDDKNAKDDAPGGRGATAIGWKKSLTVDRTKSKASMVGDVIINHEPLAAGAAPVVVKATEIEADLTDPPADAAIGLKKVTAKGHIDFTTGGSEFEGTTLTYDAETGRIVAAGTDRDPLRVVHNGINGSASEVRYNLKLGQIESIENFIATARK